MIFKIWLATFNLDFQDIPEADRHKEEERLKEVEGKFTEYMAKVKENRKKFDIMGIK